MQAAFPSNQAAAHAMTVFASPHRSLCRRLLLAAGFAGASAMPLHSQTGGVNLSQQLAFTGLATANAQGQFNAVATDAAGEIYLLLNEGDGVRVLKTDNAGATVLAQTKLGAAGDIGLALCLDPAGHVYATGTTTSTALTGTVGSAIPNRTDSSTNSFVAGFDGSLNPQWVSFTGGSRIVATAIAATADAVFVTGYTYGSNLPVTASAILQTPAYGSSQNGFAERFSTSGSALVYATYLTGAEGSTQPAAIAADSADDAYVAGSTTSSGYPTVAAVVPAMIGETSGFVTKLSPAGDGLLFSTFVPGNGITSAAMASTGATLLLAGSVDPGSFPVTAVAMPQVPAAGQALVRLSLDGSTVSSSLLLGPGTSSNVAAGPGDSAWVEGLLTSPLLPLLALDDVGLGFAMHVTAAGAIDQTARFGGAAKNNPSYASLPIALNGIAVDAAGEAIVAGAVQPTTSGSLLAAQTYDLPLTAATSALPATLSAAIPAAASCSGSICPGGAAYAAKVSTASAAPSLVFSTDTLPLVTLRNLGSAEATGLQIASTGVTASSGCGTSLYAGSECAVLLGGGGAGTLSAAASNAATRSVAIPAFTASGGGLAVSPHELDFGIQTATSPTTVRTLTITNLGQAAATFTSALDASVYKSTSTPLFTQTGTDCTGSGAANGYTLAAGAVCHVSVGFAAASSGSSDGFQSADWLVAGYDVALTGYSEAASLSVSSTVVSFGTQYAGGLRLPRYIYLSNNSTAEVAHSAVAVEAGSAFRVVDGCPLTLEPQSVCRIEIDYLAASAPSSDALLLTLDGGLSVQIAGQTLVQPSAIASSVNPNLTVTPTAVSFANSVVVTEVSGGTQTVTVGNAGASAFPITLALTGDFTEATNCGSRLAGGATCSVALTFTPSQPGTRNGLLTVATGTGSAPVYVALSGTGTSILPGNDGTLIFASTPVGEPAVQWYKVAQPFTSLTATATGPYAVLLVEDTGYGYGEPPPSAFLAAATGSCRSCYLGVQFTPTAAGVQTGALSLSSVSGGMAYALSLTGAGVASSGLLLTPVTADFGAVPLSSVSGTSIFALTNASGAAVNVAVPAFTGDFQTSSAVTGGAACGGALANAATCYFAVQFAPSATGSRSGSVSLATGAGTVSASLTGFGAANPGIALKPTSLTFRNVPGATATAQTVTVTNTAAATVQLGAPSTGTASFAVSSGCGSLAPGASCTETVTFTPGTAQASDTLEIPVTASLGGIAPATAVYTVALSGAYTSEDAGLQILPQQAEYGPQTTANEGETRQFTVNNLTAKTLAVAIALPRQFVLVGQPCTALAPNASCTFSVAFLPLTNGDVTGTIFAVGTPSDGSAAVNGIAYLEGYGQGGGSLTLTGGGLSNGLVNFGQVISGQTAAKTLTLTNGGTAPVTVRRISSDPPFYASSTCGAALAPAQTCTVTVTFEPVNQVATGTASPVPETDDGSLTIESDAATSPAFVNLTGIAGPVTVASPSNTTPLATYTLSQSSLSFAATPVGDSSATQTVTMTNDGTGTLHVLSLGTTANFSVVSGCGTLVAGASCALAVAATPQSNSPLIGALEIATDGADALDFVSLLGIGAPASLTLSAASLSFGATLVGTSAVLTEQVTNATGGPVTLGAIAASGDYTVSGNCPASGSALAAGAACTLQVTFTPAANGTRNGTLSIASSASTQPLTVALTGTGTEPQLTVAPASLAFGAINLGSSANLSLTLTNAGTGPLSGLTLTITGDYAITGPCGTTTLAAGASCIVQVAFTPTAAGSRLGTLTLTSTAPGSPASVALSGTGVANGSFALTANGSATASVSIPGGAPANYNLLATPLNGYTGTVALTCAPVNPGPYTTCSIVASTLNLASGSESAVATITTITSTVGHVRRGTGGSGLALGLMLPGIWLASRRRRRWIAASLCALLLAMAAGCGGGTTASIFVTPAGTYQYQVTASATGGPRQSQTVNLTLIVQ